MNHFQKQTIEDTELVLTSKDHNYLGPDLTLKRCRLVLRTNARALTINNVELIDCQIEAKRKLVNCQMWRGAVIRGCTFTGVFSGNDFGHWPVQDPNGGIENCDFSNAVLDGCDSILLSDEIAVGQYPVEAVRMADITIREAEKIYPYYKSLDSWDRTQAINVRGVFLGTKFAIPAMRQAGGGSIINFGSMSWHEGQGGMTGYTTAKAGIEGMTRGLARDLGPGHTIVTILADSGGRYQSKLFNPAFMRSKNLPVPAWLEKRTKIDVPFEIADGGFSFTVPVRTGAVGGGTVLFGGRVWVLPKRSTVTLRRVL
jgi:hypothetical protein